MLRKLKQTLLIWLKEYWPFFLPPLLILPGLTDFAFPGTGAEYSDIVVTHYPNAVFLKRSLISEGTIPLWSPNILSGYPFIAHPHSGIWYPPLWLALLFPLPLGLNLMVAAHMLVAGVSLYAFLRLKGLSRRAAILAGLAFEAAPKLIAHFAAGQILLVSAVCLTPLIFWASLRHSAHSGFWSRLFQPGLILAFIFFVDPRWAFYAGATWAMWRISHSHRDSIVSLLFSTLKQMMLTVLIILPMLWAFLEFTSLSTRVNLSPAEVLALSLPIESIFGFVIPQWGGFHEWILYPGILVITLALFSLPVIKRRSRALFWVYLIAVTLALSLGENLPGLESLAGIPGFSLLRIPPRALFLSLLGLAVLAAYGFDALEEKISLGQLRPFRLALLTLTAFLVLISIFLSGEPASAWQPALWAALLTSTFWFFIERRRSAKISSHVFFLVVSILLFLDLALIAGSLIRFRPAEQVLAEDEKVTSYLLEQEGMYRVYSPSYSLGQHSAVLNQLEQTDGVDPIQLSSYVDFFSTASGVPTQGYTSTQPPFESGDPANANAGYQPDAGKLGLLNVAFVLSEFPLESEGLDLREHLGGTIIYANSLVKARAWLQAPNGDERAVEMLEWGTNQIRVQAEGPGKLILSEIDYPGWQVRVDNESAEIINYAGILRSVNLREGLHEVEFRFLPRAIIWGLPISLVTLLFLVLWPAQKREKV